MQWTNARMYRCRWLDVGSLTRSKHLYSLRFESLRIRPQRIANQNFESESEPYLKHMTYYLRHLRDYPRHSIIPETPIFLWFPHIILCFPRVLLCFSSCFIVFFPQIDNAQNFADMGGLELVIKDLNHTEPRVRSEAAFVIGSATQR